MRWSRFYSGSITIGGWSSFRDIEGNSFAFTIGVRRPEGTVEIRVGAGAEGEVISTFIASSETIRVRLLGVPAVLVGDKGQSPEGVETTGRGDGGISGLITEGAGDVVMV
ncbi:hypothetical protein GLOIN_2v1785348 [Rhizophagus irregularis DAOM 181602=DAOM 197198]|nr:hypothetical protein GLOIN_2v1785348 [Rhizophagus irregularis DAOM 181602=DAOM 197198]